MGQNITSLQKLTRIPEVMRNRYQLISDPYKIVRSFADHLQNVRNLARSMIS